MKKRPLSPQLPDYENARRFLRAMEGRRNSQYIQMMKDIWAHIGNPKSQVNWQNPDEWIPERLDGESQELAWRLWLGSEKTVNPRYSDDIRAFCGNHQLATYPQDIYELTEIGKRFLVGDEDVIQSIDEYEGALFILSEIMAQGPCKRLDMLDSFTDFCHTHTTWKAHSSIDSALSARFRHLRERMLIDRIGHTYQATDAGISYLMRRHQDGNGSKAVDLSIHKLVSDNNKAAKEQLREFLQTMDPYRFEHLIKRLLEEMGYDNVAVTAPTNDKGVDVVGDIELGISQVREVIQVKRQQSNVGRGVLDSLRGSIHRFDAVRATIITTSGFSKGAENAAFEKGVAPITLIDGERLLDLLIEHDIGIRRREIRILEFDAASLSEFNAGQSPIDDPLDSE